MALPNKESWSEWDFNLRTAANKVNGVASDTKNATNSAIQETPEDIWQVGGTLEFLSDPETMSIFSSSVNDDGNPEGTGAHTITIYGLDENYNVLVETLTLDGVATVLTSNFFLRVNRMIVNSVGSSGVNEGDIIATATISGTIQAQISADVGSTLKSQYTVPNGYTAFIKNISFGMDNADRIIFDLQIRPEGESWISIYMLTTNDFTFQQTYDIPFKVRNKSDIRARSNKIAGAGSTAVSANYQFYLVKNKLVTQNDFYS